MGQTVISSSSKDSEVTFQVPTAGSYTVWARIKDSIGAETLMQVPIEVTNTEIITSDLQEVTDERIANAIATGDRDAVCKAAVVVGEALAQLKATTRRTGTDPLTSQNLAALDIMSGQPITSASEAALM